MKPLLALAVAILSSPVVLAFPSGAGDCSDGEPSVSGSHVWRPPSPFGSTHQISITMDGTDITTSDFVELTLDQDHQLVLETDGFFRGFLWVASKCEATWSIPTHQQANVQEAWACDSDAPGVSHNHRGDKTRVEAALRIGHFEGWSKLDLNVVITNTASEGSNWHYYGWKIQGREANPETPLPSSAPSMSPTREPTLQPTESPSFFPTSIPTMEPSPMPSRTPTFLPTLEPTLEPTIHPSNGPSRLPSVLPSVSPSDWPSLSPSIAPSPEPTPKPTKKPTPKPTPTPTAAPTTRPTVSPSPSPTDNPSVQPTKDTAAPTIASTPPRLGDNGVNAGSPSAVEDGEGETDPSMSPTVPLTVSPASTTKPTAAPNAPAGDSQPAVGARATSSTASTSTSSLALLLLAWYGASI